MDPEESSQADEPPTTEGADSIGNGCPDAATSQPPARATEPRWRVVICFLLMLAAIQVALGPKIAISQWGISGEGTGGNAAVKEGTAWLHGRLDIACEGDPRDPGRRPHDTAYFGGKAYNVFPPLMSILTVLLHPIHAWVLQLPEDMWSPWTYTALVYWPLPIVGFIVFRRQTGDAAWAAFLTVAWMGGTAVLGGLREAQVGLLGRIDHVISQVGLLLIAADILGRRRIWPALIGLLIATYTRQITFLYGLPLLWIAWKQPGRRPLVTCIVGLAVIAAPILTLNYLKFGNPLSFGYKYIYEGRDDEPMADRCHEFGVFHPHFIPENLYYMHAAPPRVGVSLTGISVSDANQNGTSLWMTTPLMLWVILAAPKWWRDKSRRILMLGTLPVMFGLLCYHSPGYLQHGYNRFALDFIPLWLVAVAPHTRGQWRTWFTLVCTAWSLLYFQAIVPNSPVLDRPAARQAMDTVSNGRF
jgi:hypothetical protein